MDVRKIIMRWKEPDFTQSGSFFVEKRWTPIFKEQHILCRKKENPLTNICFVQGIFIPIKFLDRVNSPVQFLNKGYNLHFRLYIFLVSY